MLERLCQTTAVRGLLLLPIGLTACISLYAGEPELVSIQTLLSAQAASYQSHMVTLQGVVSELELSPPLQLPGAKCPAWYGRATFLLEDDTGSLPVEVRGSCNPKAGEALPKDGDRVRITAIVHVLKSEPPLQVNAQATSIQILE